MCVCVCVWVFFLCSIELERVPGEASAASNHRDRREKRDRTGKKRDTADNKVLREQGQGWGPLLFLATLFSLSHTMQGLATHTLTHREEGRCRDSVWEEGRLLGRAGCHCPRQGRLTARQGHPTRQTVATTALRPSPTLSKKGWRWPSWPPGYRLPGPLNPPPWSMGGVRCPRHTTLQHGWGRGVRGPAQTA